MSTTYAPPTITAAGLTIPTFAAISAYVNQQYQSIYGITTAITPETSDGQWLGIISTALYTTCLGLQYLYNNRGPATATGAALDGVCKLNGIVRNPATYSQVELTLTGTAGTTITNGVVQDALGYLWNLDSPTMLSTSPVHATCQTAGAVNANPGSVTVISTPVAGWTGVTNSAAAIPGSNIESDSALRARQAISVAIPSETRLAGTIADLLQTPNVTRVNVLENQTSIEDTYLNPPHSLTCVVEGGSDSAVAVSIFDNRGIGCYTNANPGAPQVGVNVPDPNTGFLTYIQFNRPLYVQPYVTCTVHGGTGFTSTTLAQIQTDIISYLNSLTIGSAIAWGECISAALNARSNPDAPTFTITSLYLGLTASPTGVSNIPLFFYQVSQGIDANVIVNNA
ncbi:unnamed protein product [Sphagnum balticum]